MDFTNSINKRAVACVYSSGLEMVRQELLITRKLGNGEFGVVFEGSYRGERCAVKTLKAGVRTDTLAYRCLMGELSILASLKPHAHVAGLVGACIDDLSQPLLIQELVSGPNLQELLDRKREGFRLEKSQMAMWSMHLMLALEYLHEQTPVIMHRDVKPSNLLVGRDGLKLADFGLATQILGPTHGSNVGTPRYTAPEVFSKGRTATYTERIDIYSAALVIWYLVTGHRPCCRVDEFPLARPDLAQARKRWPSMANLLRSMWAHEPHMRPSAKTCVLAMCNFREHVCCSCQ